jgi:diguanylate cyclase (GGDEF)-like protein
MDGSTGTLLTASASLGAATWAVVRAGRRQRRFRGWPFWAGALAAGAVGLVLSMLAEQRGWHWLTMPTQILMLAWPMLLLAGTRQFHGRLGLPGTARGDVVVLVGAAASSGLAAALPGIEPAAQLLPGVAALLLHLYVAAVLASGRTGEDVVALRLLAAATAMAVLVPAAAWAASGAIVGDAPGLGLRATSAGIALAVVAFSTLSLMSERTERELRESRRRLQVLAYTDALTGIPNRRHFEDLAGRILHAGQTPVLLLFDIDHFKLINDRLGHSAGDRALQLVGAGLRDVLRAHDVAGRLGGDEFALLLCDTSLGQAMRVADRIVQRLHAAAPAQRLPRIGLSFGLVQTRAAETLDESLRRADQALYEAKRQGRSCAVAAHGEEARPVFSESQRLGLTAM